MVHNSAITKENHGHYISQSSNVVVTAEVVTSKHILKIDMMMVHLIEDNNDDDNNAKFSRARQSFPSLIFFFCFFVLAGRESPPSLRTTA